MRRIAYLYVFDTMADWEPGYVISELHSGRFFKDNSFKFGVKTVSLSMSPVTTMGGLRILPDLAIDSLNTREAGLLLLPGGDTWLEPLHDPVFFLGDVNFCITTYRLRQFHRSDRFRRRAHPGRHPQPGRLRGDLPA